MDKEILDSFRIRDEMEKQPEPKKNFTFTIYVADGFIENLTGTSKQLQQSIQQNPIIPESSKQFLKESAKNIIRTSIVNGRQFARRVQNDKFMNSEIEQYERNQQRQFQLEQIQVNKQEIKQPSKFSDLGQFTYSRCIKMLYFQQPSYKQLNMDIITYNPLIANCKITGQKDYCKLLDFSDD